VLPRRLAEAGYEFRHLTISAALSAELGGR
jgi:NAD dependent epimerase/dehydratase family enzyme